MKKLITLIVTVFAAVMVNAQSNYSAGEQKVVGVLLSTISEITLKNDSVIIETFEKEMQNYLDSKDTGNQGSMPENSFSENKHYWTSNAMINVQIAVLDDIVFNIKLNAPLARTILEKRTMARILGAGFTAEQIMPYISKLMEADTLSFKDITLSLRSIHTDGDYFFFLPTYLIQDLNAFYNEDATEEQRCEIIALMEDRFPTIHKVLDSEVNTYEAYSDEQKKAFVDALKAELSRRQELIVPQKELILAFNDSIEGKSYREVVEIAHEMFPDLNLSIDELMDKMFKMFMQDKQSGESILSDMSQKVLAEVFPLLADIRTALKPYADKDNSENPFIVKVKETLARIDSTKNTMRNDFKAMMERNQDIPFTDFVDSLKNFNGALDSPEKMAKAIKTQFGNFDELKNEFFALLTDSIADQDPETAERMRSIKNSFAGLDSLITSERNMIIDGVASKIFDRFDNFRKASNGLELARQITQLYGIKDTALVKQAFYTTCPGFAIDKDTVRNAIIALIAQKQGTIMELNNKVFALLAECDTTVSNEFTTIMRALYIGDKSNLHAFLLHELDEVLNIGFDMMDHTADFLTANVLMREETPTAKSIMAALYSTDTRFADYINNGFSAKIIKQGVNIVSSLTELDEIISRNLLSLFDNSERTSIQQVKAGSFTDRYYNLSGQQVSADTKGIIINPNGGKILVK